MGVMTVPIRYSKYDNNFMVIAHPLDAALKKTHSLYLGFLCPPYYLYDFKGGWAAPGGLVELREVAYWAIPSQRDSALLEAFKL